MSSSAPHAFASPAATAGDVFPPASSGPPAAGPGWYESSWELLNGLEVCEVPALETGCPAAIVPA